jgi:hypothetical protein
MSSSPTASIIYGVRLGFRDEDDVRFENGPDMLDEARDSYTLEADLREFIHGCEVADGARALTYGTEGSPGYIIGFEFQSTYGCELLAPYFAPSRWDQQIKDLAERLGVDISDKPIGWHVAAFYG